MMPSVAVIERYWAALSWPRRALSSKMDGLLPGVETGLSGKFIAVRGS